jgi:TonB family protein
MDDLVEHIAAVSDLIRPQKVLVAPLEGCLLDEQICTDFEAGVKERLEQMLPSVGFVERQEVIATVKKLGFLGLHAYNSNVLGRTASETGTDILVTETLKWGTDAYELAAEVLDVKNKDGSLIRLELKVQRFPLDSEDDPLVFKAPDNGLSLIVRRGEKIRSSVFHDIHCTHCPDPKYSEAARKAKLLGTIQLVLTLTEEGLLQDIRVVKSLDPTLDAAAVEAVRTWKITPAIGFDRKPFAVRTHTEITFRTF